MSAPAEEFALSLRGTPAAAVPPAGTVAVAAVTRRIAAGR
jgi:hypothetical protein